MSETKHTPGPWHLSDDGRTVLSHWSHPVATLSDPSHRQVESRSGGSYTGNDGPLIAAAPDMLEALRALDALYAWAWDTTDGGLVFSPNGVARFEKAHADAVAAIEKATGRAIGKGE